MDTLTDLCLPGCIVKANRPFLFSLMDTSRVLYLRGCAVKTNGQTDRESFIINGHFESLISTRLQEYLFANVFTRSRRKDSQTDNGPFLLRDTSRVLYLQDCEKIYLPMTLQTNRQWLFLTNGHFEGLISTRLQALYLPVTLRGRSVRTDRETNRQRLFLIKGHYVALIQP